MMASAELLQAYLQWQSEMGTEEVILLHPIRKPAAAAGAPSGGQRSHAESAPSQRPDPVQRDPGPSRAYPDAAFPPASPAVPAGLFESLSKALEQGVEPPPGSAPPRTARGSETSLPAFPDLAGLWAHLESAPHLLTGESPPVESSGSDVARMVRPVRGSGPIRAPLALIGFEPGEGDAEGKPFRAEAGALLEKMMRAIRLDMGELYLSSLIKIGGAGKSWSRRELARLVPVLHAELGLAESGMVLLLGQECAQAVLKTGKTLEELRQETHRLDGREFFVTYHPQELLRKEELKRKAWEDLQWLQRRMAEAKART